MQNWGACFGFLLVVGLKWTLVSLHPLGFEAKGVGIHQRQPNYLPTYNGIFSIHALNFTSSTADTPALSQQIISNASATDDNEDEKRTDDPESKLPSEEGTAANEVDSENRLEIVEQTTFPQLHVVTQTISGGATTTGEEEDSGTTAAQKEAENGGATTEIRNGTVPDPTHEDTESLLEGSDESEERPESEDLFDRLMRTIQGHWLEFVGKMKMSVLDVWKSISHHMMERLENFATGV